MDAGRMRGIWPPWLMNSWARISSMVGLFDGSLFKIFVMRSRAASVIGTFSGKE